MMFVEEVVERIACETRDLPSGVKSLAHLMIVVPTAQSARHLRRELARRFGAIVPPATKTPAQVLDLDETGLATRGDEIAAFWETMGEGATVELAAQLSDIRAILGANACSFADVREVLRRGDLLQGDLVDQEIERWGKLSAQEERYLAALARRGKRDRIEAVKARLADPPSYPEIERIVVAGVLDPLPLMERALSAIGKPVERIDPVLDDAGILDTRQISAFGTSAAEAAAAARYFAQVQPDEALPSLCLADAAMFPELKAAFEAEGLGVHNPSATRIATSPLGHLVSQLAALTTSSSYRVFSAFLRSGDVRRWVCAELHLSAAEFTAAIAALDRRQQELLPETIEDIAPKTEKKLRLVFDFITAKLRKLSLRQLLAAIFRDHILDERDESSREFAAAAEAVNALIDECFAPSVPEAIRRELFAFRLDEASYSLEPDEGEIVITDGWLELPYVTARELVIVGFQEGVVPEAVVGHPFVPDSLREALGLPTNRTRTERDRRILAIALACRETPATRISFHSIDATGDTRKPSRLIFDTSDDDELVRRVRRFYGVRAGTGEMLCADLPPEWKLHLPFPPEHRQLERISPTRLDDYLSDPFTAYLKDKSVLGDKPLDDRAEELAAWEYGNLAHEALEEWGRATLAGDFTDHEDAERIAAFLAAQVDGRLEARFGGSIPAIVAMQGESVKRRLANFAVVQSARYREGWRIRAVEEKLEVVYGHTRFFGKCDRIDFNTATGQWCVIDYKTWDSPERARILAKSSKGEGGPFNSLQLPLYCAMLNASGDERFCGIARDNILAAYCVLGKTNESVGFSEPADGHFLAAAEREIRRLIRRWEAGIFWPPSKGANAQWRWNYEQWLAPDPFQSVDERWIADQERRIAEFASEENAREGGE